MLYLISTAYAADIPTPPVPPGYCDTLNWDDLRLKALECVFNRVYNAAILSVGAVFIIWMIISGIRYLAAGGDEKAVAAARHSLTFAVIGFITVIAAYAIIQILANLLGWPLPIPPFRLPAASP